MNWGSIKKMRDGFFLDLDPTRWSWSDGSPDLRPGLHNNDSVPRVPNGRGSRVRHGRKRRYSQQWSLD